MLEQKTFKFSIAKKDQKEQYSQEDVNKILEQQVKAFSGYAEEVFTKKHEDYETLSKFKENYDNMVKQKSVLEVAQKINSKNYEKLVKYANINSEDSEEEIQKKLEEVNEDIFKNDSNENSDTTSQNSKLFVFPNLFKKDDKDKENEEKDEMSAADQYKLNVK